MAIPLAGMTIIGSSIQLIAFDSSTLFAKRTCECSDAVALSQPVRLGVGGRIRVASWAMGLSTKIGSRGISPQARSAARW